LKNNYTTPFLFLFLMAMLRPHFSFAQKNYLPGARSLGLAHASVSFSDTWSVFHNQAGITGLQYISAGFYFESRFGLDELSLAAVSTVLPTSSGTFGLSFLQFGQEVYKENKLGLAYALQLAERWSAGIQLDYLCLTLPDSRRSRGVATFEGGILFGPSEKLQFGVHAFHPVPGGITTPSGIINLPAVLRTGGHYHFDNTVMTAFELMKNSHHPLRFKSGIEWVAADKLIMRMGVSGKPFAYTAGIGFRSGSILTDIAFSSHSNLGITPSVSIQICTRKK
jgi:hypothetical protein